MSDKKRDCVCWDKVHDECSAITKVWFIRGFNCKQCAFYKTADEYKKQTGHTYEEEMEEVKQYRGSNNRRER